MGSMFLPRQRIVQSGASVRAANHARLHRPHLHLDAVFVLNHASHGVAS